MNVVRKLLRMEPGPNEKSSTVELLKRTPLEQLEETVKALKNHRPATEVRQAMIEVITAAPLSHFETLKRIFLMHCQDGAK
jgi:hypothetical protein